MSFIQSFRTWQNCAVGLGPVVSALGAMMGRHTRGMSQMPGGCSQPPAFTNEKGPRLYPGTSPPTDSWHIAYTHEATPPGYRSVLPDGSLRVSARTWHRRRSTKGRKSSLSLRWPRNSPTLIGMTRGSHYPWAFRIHCYSVGGKFSSTFTRSHGMRLNSIC